MFRSTDSLILTCSYSFQQQDATVRVFHRNEHPVEAEEIAGEGMSVPRERERACASSNKLKLLQEKWAAHVAAEQKQPQLLLRDENISDYVIAEEILIRKVYIPYKKLDQGIFRLRSSCSSPEGLLDIGANIGAMLIFLDQETRICAPPGENNPEIRWVADCYEPSIPNLHQLRLCAEQFDKDQVKVHWSAVTADYCTSTIFHDRVNACSGCAARSSTEKFDKYDSNKRMISYKVPGVRLDEILKPYHTILKLDCEGGEHGILMGTKDFLNIRVAMIEWSAGRERRDRPNVSEKAWEPFTEVLDKFKEHFTHIFIPGAAYTQRFWIWDRKVNQRCDYDFVFFAYSARKDPLDVTTRTETRKLWDLRTKWKNFRKIIAENAEDVKGQNITDSLAEQRAWT